MTKRRRFIPMFWKKKLAQATLQDASRAINKGTTLETLLTPQSTLIQFAYYKY